MAERMMVGDMRIRIVKENGCLIQEEDGVLKHYNPEDDHGGFIVHNAAQTVANWEYTRMGWRGFSVADIDWLLYKDVKHSTLGTWKLLTCPQCNVETMVSAKSGVCSNCKRMNDNYDRDNK